jgi:hypothetical protein
MGKMLFKNGIPTTKSNITSTSVNSNPYMGRSKECLERLLKSYKDENNRLMIDINHNFDEINHNNKEIMLIMEALIAQF